MPLSKWHTRQLFHDCSGSRLAVGSFATHVSLSILIRGSLEGHCGIWHSHTIHVIAAMCGNNTNTQRATSVATTVGFFFVLQIDTAASYLSLSYCPPSFRDCPAVSSISLLTHDCESNLANNSLVVAIYVRAGAYVPFPTLFTVMICTCM